MKKLFLIFAKLLGLVQLYMALLNATQLVVMLGMVAKSDHLPLRGILLGVAGLVIYLAIAIAIAWLMLAKTEWLAGKVGIHDDPPIEGLEQVPALRVGICLIGIFVIVGVLPRLARILIDLHQAWHFQPHQLIWGQLAPNLLQLLLGLVLALKSDQVITLVARKPAQAPAP